MGSIVSWNRRASCNESCVSRSSVVRLLHGKERPVSAKESEGPKKSSSQYRLSSHVLNRNGSSSPRSTRITDEGETQLLLQDAWRLHDTIEPANDKEANHRVGNNSSFIPSHSMKVTLLWAFHGARCSAVTVVALCNKIQACTCGWTHTDKYIHADWGNKLRGANELLRTDLQKLQEFLLMLLWTLVGMGIYEAQVQRSWNYCIHTVNFEWRASSKDWLRRSRTPITALSSEQLISPTSEYRIFPLLG